jgi:hypothetical protein
MLSGFNTNFRYRGVLFHVQTEDSGRDNPRVFTHLFKGGDILASMKGDYSDKLESASFEAEVRSLMESQHKAMLKALSRGEHDPLIMERMGAGIFRDQSATDTDATLPPPEVTAPETTAAEELVAKATSPKKARATKKDAGAASPSAQSANPESPKERIVRVFGDGVVSQKPLDEVVLEYLVDNARKRKRSSK